VAGSASNYAEATATAATYSAALTAANAAFTATVTLDYYAVQVGTDVVVFVNADSDGDVDGAIALAGKTLADIDFGNFV
jgi:hypothetical protein